MRVGITPVLSNVVLSPAQPWPSCEMVKYPAICFIVIHIAQGSVFPIVSPRVYRSARLAYSTLVSITDLKGFATRGRPFGYSLQFFQDWIRLEWHIVCLLDGRGSEQNGIVANA